MKSPYRILEVCLLGGLVAWLFAAAFVVQIEYYDGYDSICNAGYFLGEVKQYTATRSPFFGLILVPAEWVKQRLDMHPLEVRPHHITMALLHAVYLLGCYAMLIRLRGRNGASLLAFIAAVPTFVFLTYAPFISHDLLPGVCFLGMLLLAERFVGRPNWKAALGLIALGAVAACIKHTYALFWIFVLVIQVAWWVQGKVRPDDEAIHVPLKSMALLGCCALVSGLIVAGVLGFALSGAFPEQGFLERIGSQIKYLSSDAHDKSQVPPWWVYLRNFPAYGTLASLLVLPGIWLSWKESRRMKGLVLAWILSVVVMHLIGIRQVRYLAFIMPITAVLIVPVVQRILTFKEGLPAMLTVMFFTQFTGYSQAMELTRPFSTFYRESEARALLAQHPFPKSEQEKQVLVSNAHMLSFYDGRNTPLVGDVYHNLFHLDLHHLVDLYRLPNGSVGRLDVDAINRLEYWPDKSSILVVSAGMLMNPVRWESAPPLNHDTLEQMVYQAESLRLTRVSEIEYKTEDERVALIATGELNGQMIFAIQADWLVPMSPHVVNIRIHQPGQTVPVYGRINGGNQWLIPGFKPPAMGEARVVRFFQKKPNLSGADESIR